MWDPHGGVHRLDELVDLPDGLRPESVTDINGHYALLRARDADGALVTAVLQLS